MFYMENKTYWAMVPCLMESPQSKVVQYVHHHPFATQSLWASKNMYNLPKMTKLRGKLEISRVYGSKVHTYNHYTSRTIFVYYSREKTSASLFLLETRGSKKGSTIMIPTSCRHPDTQNIIKINAYVIRILPNQFLPWPLMKLCLVAYASRIS